jgi:hypothetical protein
LGTNLKDVPQETWKLSQEATGVCLPQQKIGEVITEDITHYVLRSIPYEVFNIQRRKLISICAFQVRTWRYISVRFPPISPKIGGNLTDTRKHGWCWRFLNVWLGSQGTVITVRRWMLYLNPLARFLQAWYHVHALSNRPFNDSTENTKLWRIISCHFLRLPEDNRRVHWSTGHTPQPVTVRILLAKIPQKY